VLTRPRLRLAPLAAWLALAAPAAADQPPLQTVAEKSDYKATSRHAEVVAFCEELAKRSPLVRLGQLGVSGEGRKLPLVILADPPVATPEEAAKSGKPVAFVIANIHAGEVDGKEAVLALARDLVTAKDRPLLKELVIVFAPNFNADGNERIDKAHRTEQVGPAEGVGIRENAAGLDLNRDFVKLESPEVRALVKALDRWDAALFVDCHTTNGSHHRYPLTYDGARHPSCPPGLVELVRDRLLPDAGARLEKTTRFPSFTYGNFVRDHTVWETYPAEPRYGVQYAGLCGRASVLSESYSYASFRDRVKASYGFVLGCLEFAAAHKGDVRKARQAKPPQTLALRTKAASLGERKVLGYVEEKKDGRTVATDRPREYTVDLLGKVEPTLTVARPYAYLFPPSYAAAVEVLQRHGVTVEELREDVELDVEAYRIDAVKRAREFQKHKLVSADATVRK
jgi:dipeptidyl-peptidase 4